MIRLFRWVAIGFCLINLVALLSDRGGLGEYLRGSRAVTAHLGTCRDHIDDTERSHITCSARWTVSTGEVEGSVTDVDPAGVTAVAGSSWTDYEVRLPAGATEMRVFARGAGARPADTTSMWAGGGVLLAIVGLLAWESIVILRRHRFSPRAHRHRAADGR